MRFYMVIHNKEDFIAANCLLACINMSLTIPNLVPQRPFCYINFISVAKPQKFGNKTYDAYVLASSNTYRKQNKPKKVDSEPVKIHAILTSQS